MEMGRKCVIQKVTRGETLRVRKYVTEGRFK
jgi:hypothetical protein